MADGSEHRPLKKYSKRCALALRVRICVNYFSIAYLFAITSALVISLSTSLSSLNNKSTPVLDSHQNR